MADSALFQELAKAKARPSGAFLDADAALGAVGGTIHAIQAQKDQQTNEALKKAAVLDNFGKLVDSVGYNRASQIFPFQKLGIDPGTAAQTYGPKLPNTVAPSATGPLGLNGALGTTGPTSSPSLPPLSPSSGPDIGEQFRSGDIGANQLDRELKLRSNELTSQQNAPATFDQVDSFFKSANHPEIGQSLINSAKSTGKNYVQKDIFDKAVSLVGPKSDIADSLNRRTDLAVANAINKNVNALVGSGALGTAGKNNLRISRVKALLERNTPLTPSELELVTTDMAGVIQGGVPLKDTVEGQTINTIASKMANLLKSATNTPQVFNDSGFRQRLVMLGNEMISADNKVQEKAFNTVKANYGHLTTPEHLDRVHQAIIDGEQLPILDIQSGETPGASGTNPIGQNSTGDPEADQAISLIMSSALPDAAKQARIKAVHARASR